MQLVQRPQGQIVGGQIRLKQGDKAFDIAKMTQESVQRIRGNEISMIFQEPMTSLNPVFTIGDQLIETFMQHQGLSRSKAWAKGIEMLRMVRIPLPEQRMKEFPYQHSGGMRQRVMIAMALACQPELLIADEPTTALDVTIQAQVLDLMKDLKKKYQMSMILITHDLGVVADICDTVAIMYAGEIVEYGTVEDIFDRYSHPYTEGLFNSIPSIDGDRDELKVVAGLTPDPTNLPKGCIFHPRCPYAAEKCARDYPENIQIGESHYVRCFRFNEWRQQGE